MATFVNSSLNRHFRLKKVVGYPTIFSASDTARFQSCVLEDADHFEATDGTAVTWEDKLLQTHLVSILKSAHFKPQWVREINLWEIIVLTFKAKTMTRFGRHRRPRDRRRISASIVKFEIFQGEWHDVTRFTWRIITNIMTHSLRTRYALYYWRALTYDAKQFFLRKTKKMFKNKTIVLSNKKNLK